MDKQDVKTITIEDYFQGPQEISLESGGILICDIDGTIADITHRLHFIQQPKKDWPGFFKACGDDAPIPLMISMVQLIENCGWVIYYVTGRREQERVPTSLWLARMGLPQGDLLMRANGDYRPDTAVKSDLYDIMLSYDVAADLVLEDRDRVVRMWRDRGVRCIQVAEGLY